MVDVEIKGLVGRLNKFCTRGLEAAAAKCVSRTNYEVTPEHMLFVMNEDPNADLQAIYKHFGVDVGQVQKALSAAIEEFRTGNTSRPVFSPILLDWFQSGWLLGSVDYGMGEIRSGVLLWALLNQPERYAASDYLTVFAGIKRGELKAQLIDLTRGSIERYETRDGGRKGGDGEAKAEKGSSGESALAKFCTDFTGKARENKLDPVFGRDPEIRQMVDILARRRKNNPICVGDPGVGKTAVVEGLAIRIVEGDVPDSLRGVELMGLDLALLQAGASVKGEFENRLKNVINEVKASPKPIILFIDEAHTLVGAGGAAGTGDAGQLLKPALARGELRTIAATTWSEYKKYFEKDAALARRFQLVKLDEPNDATTVTMLRGLRDRYEQAHQVVIRDDALAACATLGSRYIAGRQHPDKGIDLMDTSAARVKVALTTKPPELQDLERSIQTIERELAAYKRDKATGADGLEEQISEREKQIAGLKDKAATLTERWQKEKTAAEKVLEIRKKMFEATGQSLGGAPVKVADAPAKKETKVKAKEEPKKETKIKTKGDPAALKKELDAALAELKAIQGKEPLIQIEVTPDIVARVISDWTGIPIGKMVQDEASSLLEFEKSLTQRVKGQDHVMKIVGTGIRAAKAGLKDPRTPIGVFLFVGPSGTGKTETALGVADLMFGGERMMTTINMSEFQEKHTTSRLIGSPPGYVGYGEGGVLTEGVRQKPYSVVLLDEVEKADPDVMNLFYQVFDKGMLSDGEGREVDFKDTVIFMTSNLASDMIQQAVPTDGSEKPPLDDLIATIRPVLSKHFKPALLARMTIVPFFPIDVNAMKDIVKLKMGHLRKRLAESHKMKLDVDEKVVDSIAARCTEVETGARNIDHILRGTLLPRISSELLQQMTQGPLPEKLSIGIDDKGEFSFAFGKK